MKRSLLSTFCSVILLCFSTVTEAGNPVWTFTPLTATTISVPGNRTATISYRVTNQSAKPHILALNPIIGVTQITTGAGVCANPFSLPSDGASCALTLQIDGSQIANGIINGPVVCEQNSQLLCYRANQADLLTVTVTPNIYTVGGAVVGLLSGTVVLQNNSIDTTPISSNTSFTFPTSLLNGAPFNVTVLTQPQYQTCVVTNGAGNINAANYTGAIVSCTINATSLSTSLANLALGVSGNPRTITVTNTGAAPAENLTITYPTWPIGTSANSNCGSVLNPGDTCTITVTPGVNPTSACNAGIGSTPTPGTVTVSASNVAVSAHTKVLILANGCLFQQGYLFKIDDTTATNVSINGSIVQPTDNSLAPIQWYNGSFIATNALSITNGAANTATIVTVQGAGSYAAELCAGFSVDSQGSTPCATGTCYNNWYLPAICQMGAPGEGAGCFSEPNNMVANLPALVSGCVGPACLVGAYWSSTESSTLPTLAAWTEVFASGGSQVIAGKQNTVSVRCVRAITP